jgi:hypothetical protein
LFPRVPNSHVEVTAVADHARDGVRKMMEVQHRFLDARGTKLTQDPSDDRLASDGHGCFGANEGKWTKPGGEAGGQDERRNHSS